MLESSRRRSGSGSPSLHLETLEDRAVPAIIGGMVYYDRNLSGLVDPGEQPIAGSQLRLLDATGKVVASTTSDAAGRYQFSKRDDVSTAPAALTYETELASTRTDVTQTASVNQFDPTLGTLTSVDIILEGAIHSQVQLENLEKEGATLRADVNGSIQFQAPGAGTIEAKPTTKLEANLPGFDGQADLSGTSGKDLGVTRLDGQFTTVTISNPTDLAAYIGGGKVNLTQSASVTSSASGPGNLLAMIRSTTQGKVKVVYHYTPSNELAPGKYTIVQTQPSAFLDWKETRDNVTPMAGTERTDAIEVTVNHVTDQSLNNHFAEAATAAVSGAVYQDSDRSGVWSAGDRPLGGVTLALNGTDIYGQAVTRTTRTSAFGDYRFVGLVPGTYVLSEVQPAGYQQGTNNIGTQGGSFVGDHIVLTLMPGTHAAAYNFGEVAPQALRADPIISPKPVAPPQASTDATKYASKFYFSTKTLLELGW